RASPARSPSSWSRRPSRRASRRACTGSLGACPSVAPTRPPGAQAPRSFSRAASDARRLEAALAARAAEVVRRPVEVERLAGARDRDGHPADRVDRLAHLLGGRDARRVPPRDELGEDRDRDLLLRGGAEVEAGGA